MRLGTSDYSQEVERLQAMVAQLLDDRRAMEREQKALQARLEQAQHEAAQARGERKALEEETKVLYRRISVLTRQLADATGKDRQQKLAFELRLLKKQLADRNRDLYGSRSERRGHGEEGSQDGAATGSGSEPAPEPKKPRKKRPGHGPTQQLQLPIEIVPHPLGPDEQTCPLCEGRIAEMEGQDDESDEITVTERTFTLLRHQYAKGHCVDCGYIVSAPRPARLVPGGRYSEEFAIAVAVDKYSMHLPLYRQTQQMKHQGLVVTRQTLWDQLLAMSKVLGPSYLALKALILSAALVFADETTWRLMQKGGTKKFWVWSVGTPEAVYYQIKPSRGTAAARSLFGDYDGTVMADAYIVYQKLEKALDKAGGRQTYIDQDGKVQLEEIPNFTLGSCWMHARRGFWKAEQAGTVEAGRALDLIAGLYAVEAKAKELAAGDPERLLEIRRELRDTLSRPIIEKLDAWRKQQRSLPKSHFGEGLTYLKNQWPRLLLFLTDPSVPLDNGLAERAMRGPVLGRKNHYGSHSQQGIEVAALFYSLIETCKLVGMDPTAYLRIAVRRALNRPGTVTLPADLMRVWAGPPES